MKKTIICQINWAVLFIFNLFIFCKQAFADGTCEPYQTYLNPPDIFDNIFYIIEHTLSNLAIASWDIFSLPLQGIVIIGIGIYIAVYTLKSLGSFSQRDASDYISNSKTGLLFLAMKGAFIVALLQHQEFVYQYLVSPIITAGAQIGGSDMLTSFPSASNITGLFATLQAYISDFYNRAYEIVAKGRFMLCLFILPDGLFNYYWSLFPFGAVLFIFGWLIIIGSSFYFFDIFFRLGVACILLPFGIACGVSKLTSSYTKKVWDFFVNTAFHLIMISVIVQFTLEMIRTSLANFNTAVLLGLISGDVSIAMVEELIANLTLASFVYLALSCIISFKLFMDVDQIVDNISGSSSVGSLGQEIGGELLKKTKGAVTSVGSEAKRFGGVVASETGKSIASTKAGRWTIGQGRNVRNKYFAMRNWVKQNVFRLDD